MTTIILRHKRENLKKCSLRGLERRADFRFFTYPQDLQDLFRNLRGVEFSDYFGQFSFINLGDKPSRYCPPKLNQKSAVIKPEFEQNLSYERGLLPKMHSTILLKIGAPPLTKKDQDKDLFLIDGTWQLAITMEKSLPKDFTERSLPNHFRTAYPRRQTFCPDPETGLASIEALYIAFFILGKPLDGLLDHYYWKDAFLKLNPELSSKYPD